MGKYTLLILIAILIAMIFVFGFAVYKYSKYNFQYTNLNKNSSENINNNNNSNTGEENKRGSGSWGGGSGGSSLRNETISEESLTNKTKQLPSDINTQNCGFYYGDYGICTGKCPEGKCISDERSCYCKKV